MLGMLIRSLEAENGKFYAFVCGSRPLIAPTSTRKRNVGCERETLHSEINAFIKPEASGTAT